MHEKMQNRANRLIPDPKGIRSNNIGDAMLNGWSNGSVDPNKLFRKSSDVNELEGTTWYYWMLNEQNRLDVPLPKDHKWNE